MRKIISLLCMAVMLMGVMMMSVSAITFSDLSDSHWAYEYITTLADKSVINGFEDGTYRPSDTVTKGQFVKLVMAACMPSWIDAEEYESSLDHWAGPYVSIAETYGIIEKGSITMDNINLPITRIEMAKMVALADMMSSDGNETYENTNRVTFLDIYSLNTNDLSLLQHAYSRGFITGYEDNTFRPNNNMTRAEAATMIYRFTK